MTYDEIRALYERLDKKYHPAYVDPAQMETLRQIRCSIERIAAEAAERGDFRWSLRLSTLDSLLRSEEALTENAINSQAKNIDGR
jgi:hypothetical protein